MPAAAKLALERVAIAKSKRKPREQVRCRGRRQRRTDDLQGPDTLVVFIEREEERVNLVE